ncbi:quinone oxidoreductase family protein [Profundibacter amoris]|uniref:Quinone oxidoreductase n=1 Tax=Profundibacter amoris TaxID=2171755 RepID=A0A347UCF9_9RHOB|nr:quinone oxidoreductase [Profundibacter amoris]AXX96537.1 quinone oxidoreductase [Profundibacter amoris]
MPIAIAAAKAGGPEVLHEIDLPTPAPKAGEVLVKHNAIGVNFIDTYFRSGLYLWPVDKDLVLGSEAAGTVAALGDGVTGFAVGDRVAYTIPNGAYVSERVIEARHLVRLPDGVSDEVAAAAMLKGLTAHYLLHRSFKVEKGQTVLFHAAAGGVGLIAGQWLAAKGVTAIGTAGGPEKCALAAKHGYAHTIDYKSEDFVERVKEITGGEGVHAVYDSIGHDTIAGSMNCLKTFGTLVNFGQSSGPYLDFKLSDLAVGSYTVTRPVLFHFTADRAYLESAASDLFAMIENGTLKINVNQRYPLAKANQAHIALEGRKTTGSTVLIP